MYGFSSWYAYLIQCIRNRLSFDIPGCYINTVTLITKNVCIDVNACVKIDAPYEFAVQFLQMLDVEGETKKKKGALALL